MSDASINTEALKHELLRDKQRGQGVYELFENPRSSSEVWRSFRLIKKHGEELKRVCACLNCLSCYLYQNSEYKSTGTHNMKSHIAQCSKKRVGGHQMLLTEAVKPTTSRTVRPAAKANLKEAVVKFVVQGRHSFASVENDGFIELCQKLVELGATYGKIDVRDVLPRRYAVTQGVENEYKEAKTAVKTMIAPSQAERAYSITVDMATDDHVKRSYLGVHAQWIDQHLNMNNCLIGLRHFGTDSHTAVNIEALTTAILEEYNLSLDTCTVVTDMGANMVAAFDSGSRLTCLAHR